MIANIDVEPRSLGYVNRCLSELIGILRGNCLSIRYRENFAHISRLSLSKIANILCRKSKPYCEYCEDHGSDGKDTRKPHRPERVAVDCVGSSGWQAGITIGAGASGSIALLGGWVLLLLGHLFIGAVIAVVGIACSVAVPLSATVCWFPFHSLWGAAHFSNPKKATHVHRFWPDRVGTNPPSDWASRPARSTASSEAIDRP